MDTKTVPEEIRTILKAFSRALTREAHVLSHAPGLLWQQSKKAALTLQDRQPQMGVSF
jgi:hypothetical protein